MYHRSWEMYLEVDGVEVHCQSSFFKYQNGTQNYQLKNNERVSSWKSKRMKKEGERVFRLLLITLVAHTYSN
jgi:hypothetical protein